MKSLVRNSECLPYVFYTEVEHVIRSRKESPDQLDLPRDKNS